MILTVEQQGALVRYLRVRAGELNYELGALEYAGPDSIRFSRFVWRVPETEPAVPTDLRHLVDVALQAQILMERPVVSNTTSYTPVPLADPGTSHPARAGRVTHIDSPIIETDVIGGFPFARPNCCGCDRPLLLENAWMSDGCECNSPLGVNSMNETRWRLLMQLQQQQNFQLAELRSIVQVQVGEFTVTEYPNGTRTIGGNIQAAPGHVILELPLP